MDKRGLEETWRFDGSKKYCMHNMVYMFEYGVRRFLAKLENLKSIFSWTFGVALKIHRHLIYIVVAFHMENLNVYYVTVR